MQRFSQFCDYMFSLLIAPLKKSKQAANQFYIFCKVIGRIFDGMKQDAFRVRAESMIVTASAAMLPVHGQDRDMPRLAGETVEAYRYRLTQKLLIAQQAGTNAGIIAAVKALGYETVRIEPLYETDAERWAEATCWISGGSVVIDDRTIIQQEIDKTKPASAKVTLAQEQIAVGTLYFGAATEIFKIIDIGQVS